MSKTILVPQGYGKLVAAAFSRPLLSDYDGEHGVSFIAKPRLWGVALSSYIPMGTTGVTLSFIVGSFSLKAARRELLTWAAIAKGSEQFLADWLTSKELGIQPGSPLTEMPPEIMVSLELDPVRAESIKYKEVSP